MNEDIPVVNAYYIRLGGDVCIRLDRDRRHRQTIDAALGKHRGRSFQLAPVRKIHKIPSSHGRGGTTVLRHGESE